MKRSPLAVNLLCLLVLAGLAYVVYMWFAMFYSPAFTSLSNDTIKVIVGIFLAINLIGVLLLWVSSFRDTIYLILYYATRKKWQAYYHEMDEKELTISSKVLLIYCYYNEFDAKALRKSVKQNYSNFEVVLLDDSTNEKVRAEMDKVVEELRAKGYTITVSRRENRKGFKGGALNEYLSSRDDYDYFAVMDCDEVLQYDFLTQMLKYFQDDKTLGGVQACHEPLKGTNWFDSNMRCTLRIGSYFTQLMRNKYGQLTLLGHGMVISREAWLACEGFPEVVVEDTAFSMILASKGYRIKYAYNVIAYEAVPPNYAAYKKREVRWVQGDIEVAKKGILRRAIRSKAVPLFAKIDLYSTVRIIKIFAPFSGLFILISTLVMWGLGFESTQYGIVVVLMGLLSFVVTLLELIIFNAKFESLGRAIVATAMIFVCVGSLASSYIGNVCLCLLGYKPIFVVTPKTGEKFSLWGALKTNIGTIIFVTILFVITWIICGNPGPALLTFIYPLAAVVVSLMSNISVKSRNVAYN